MGRRRVHAGTGRHRIRALPLLPLAVLVIGVVGSIHTNRWQQRLAVAAADERFVGDTDMLVHDIVDAVARYEELNPAILDEVRPTDGTRASAVGFSTFADSLALGSRFPGTYGIAWADSVPRARLATFLSDPSIPLSDLRDLRPDESRDQAAVVSLAEPDSTMAIARGVDAQLFPPIAEALTSAARSGEVALSEPFALPLRVGPDIDDPPVITFLVRAAYDGAQVPSGQLSDHVLGWATVALDMEPFVRISAGRLDSEYAMSVVDADAAAMPAGSADEQSAVGGRIATNRLETATGGRHREITRDVYGRRWTFSLAEAAGVSYNDPSPSDGFLWAGLMITAGVVALMSLLSTSERRARRLVERATSELAVRATHDDLTGLANRSYLKEVLDAATSSRDGGTAVAVLFLDLDRFKLVNDSLGHAAGDEVLRSTAQRLLDAVGPAHLVARLGGDEFVVVVTDQSTDVAALADRVHGAVMGRPFVLGGREFFVRTSVGIAVAASDTDSDSLLQQADAAMYAAKQEEGTRIAWFHPDLLVDARQRLELAHELRVALDADHFALAYQQVVEVSTGEVVGFEALVRWDHPSRGLLLPGAFLDDAMQTGLITQLDTLVRRRAVSDAVDWPAPAGGTSAWLAVNVSMRELGPQFADDVLSLLDGAGFDPRRLVLELTETDLAHDPFAAAELLEGLRREGVRVAVDDFGTGYSSLATLRSLPADILKIDKALVTAAAQRSEDRAVLRAIVDLGHALGLQLVAEGVETEAHLRVLVELGCDLAQGWLYGRERPAHELGGLLRRTGGTPGAVDDVVGRVTNP